MKTQFKCISYLFISMLFFSSCLTEELELNEQENLLLETTLEKTSATASLCVQHSFFPAITQEYNVSGSGFCVVSFDIGNIFAVIPPGTSNIKPTIQVIESPSDHPDGPSPGVNPVVHNFVFNSFSSIDNDTFSLLYDFSGNGPTPTLGFVTDHKRLKVSFGVVDQSIGAFCTIFKPENVFFTKASDCPY